MSIQDTISRIVRENSGQSYNWKHGDIVQHPDGYKVRIDSGCYLDPTYNRVSNFWSWTVLNKKGKPTNKTGEGYGWD